MMSKLDSMSSRPRSQTIGAMEGVVITPLSPKPRPAESPKSPPKFFLPVSTCKRAKLFGRGGSCEEDPSSIAMLSTSAPAERHFPRRSFSKSVCVIGYDRHKRDSATSGTGTTSSIITGTGISLTIPGTERLGEEEGSVEFQDYEGEQSSSDSRSAEDSDSDDTEIVDLSRRIQIHKAIVPTRSGSATPHFGLGQVDDPVDQLSGAMNNLKVHSEKMTYHASPLLTCALDNTRKLSLASSKSGDSGGFRLDLGEAQHQLPKLPASLQFRNILTQGKALSEPKPTEYSKDLPYDETIIEEV